MGREKTIALSINGRREETTVPPHRTLLEALRDLGHVEVKCGCEKGDCGACAVLLDGLAVDSCLTLAWMAEGREITTVTGLGGRDEPHPLQTAFKEHHGLQCGFCTPGMVMSAADLLKRNPDPSETEVREWLEGNLCRCTGYHNIVKAIQAAARTLALATAG